MTDVHPCWIVGAGGHAKVVIDALRSRGVSLAGVFDEDKDKNGIAFAGVVIKSISEIASLPNAQSAHIAIGSNEARARLASRLNWKFSRILHKKAWASPSAGLGDGVFVGPNAVVQADANIGEHTIVNTGAIVEHDCIVAAYVHLAPGAILGGNAQVGTGTLIGTGACVLPNINIGARCRIGAGAVVTKDIPDGSTVVGVPGAIR